MWGCVVCATVHVLSVWLVTGVAGKDITRSHATLHTHWAHKLNLNTRWGETGDRDGCSITETTFKIYTPCGDGYCRCQHEAADCSGHLQELTYIPYIPVLPRGTSSLDFILNGLKAITNDDFFHNVTNILTLDLGHNHLSYISAGAFRLLVNLTELRLEHNALTYKALDPVLSITTLTLLDLTFNPLSWLPDGLFHNTSLPHLHTLCLSNMRITSLNMSVFKPLMKLSHLDLSFNQLTEDTLIQHVLPQLNTLSLMSNLFGELPQTYTQFGPTMPNLTWLDMSQNTFIWFSLKAVYFPRLQVFACNDCLLMIMQTNTFHTKSYPLLTHAYLSSIGQGQCKTSIDEYAFNNTMLQFVTLTNSGIDFSRDDIHPDCFAGCPSLQRLDLSGNDFSRVREHKLQRLFNSRRLTELNLKSTNIGHISAQMFTNIPNLVVLWLDSNKLTDIPDGVFNKLGHLKWLDLSDNRISVVRETAFSPATRQSLQRVDLGNNPFHCDCDLMWFRQWVDKFPDLFICDELTLALHSCTTYTCDNLANTTVQSFFVADQACLWSPAVSKFIIATVILLMLPLTAGTVIYRYRWHIRLVWYEADRGRGGRWRRLQEQDFRYDVFVCYDSEDLEWVLGQLMPELEERLGLKLCIHSRDFTLGAPIVENIEESVETSKKIMMMFSKNFANSHWCQFELQLCLTHVLKHGDALIVVLLEDIPPRDLTPAMTAVIKTLTYIEWDDDPEARASFWGRIRLALHDILV